MGVGHYLMLIALFMCFDERQKSWIKLVQDCAKLIDL